MLDEPAGPRGSRGDTLLMVTREDLDLYGVSELEERVELLEAELARTKRQIEKKRAGRSEADSFFNLGKN